MDLTELSDRAEILQTLGAYCDSIDRSDLAALAEVFTEDVLIDLGNGVTVSGRDRVLHLIQDLTSTWDQTHHQCDNHLVRSYDGARAETSSYVYAFHDAPARNERMHLWGRYADELVKRDGTWRIRIRRLRVAGATVTTSSPFPERFERPERLGRAI